MTTRKLFDMIFFESILTLNTGGLNTNHTNIFTNNTDNFTNDTLSVVSICEIISAICVKIRFGAYSSKGL